MQGKHGTPFWAQNLDASGPSRCAKIRSKIQAASSFMRQRAARDETTTRNSWWCRCSLDVVRRIPILPSYAIDHTSTWTVLLTTTPA